MAIASATWGHAGFFTPFYRIAAVLDPAAYDISLEQAASGSRFWLEPQTALPGACVHLGLAAFFGMLFGLLWRGDRQAGPSHAHGPLRGEAIQHVQERQVRLPERLEEPALLEGSLVLGVAHVGQVRVEDERDVAGRGPGRGRPPDATAR